MHCAGSAYARLDALEADSDRNDLVRLINKKKNEISDNAAIESEACYASG